MPETSVVRGRITRWLSWLCLNVLLLAAVIGFVYYGAFAVDLAVDADVSTWQLPLAAFEAALWGVPFVFAIALPSAVLYLVIVAGLSRTRLRHRRVVAVVLATAITVLSHWSELGWTWWTVPALIAAVVYGSVVRLGRPA